MRSFFLFFLLFTFGIFSSQAQEQGKVRFGIDAGIPNFKGNTFGAELKYNITNWLNAGVRAKWIQTENTVDSSDPTQSPTLESLQQYYTASMDLYLDYPCGTKPFIGISAGLASIGEFSTDQNHSATTLPIQDVNDIGFLIRLGIENRKFRAAFEYAFINEKARLSESYGNMIPQEFDNGFFGATLGFYLGGGVW